MNEYFEKFYYVVPVQLVVTSVFIAASIFNFKKLKELKILLFYSIASLLQSILAIWLGSFEVVTKDKVALNHNSINLFILIEFICFYLFIIKFITSAGTKYFLYLMMVVFMSYILYDWIIQSHFDAHPSMLTVIEGYFVIIACLLYYKEIFTATTYKRLSETSSFWIVNGIFLLFAFLISLFLQRKNVLFKQLDIFNTVYIVNYFGYITLFSFFLTGLRWKIKGIISSK